MYKVFFNENLIVFTEKPTIMQGFHTEKFIDFNSQFFLKGTIYGPMAKIQVICDNLENDWKRFLLNFKVRKAAGGVVENEYNELLWIYRFDKWDLPKGHIEAGESKEIAAIREVEEECGISQLNIKKELETTYHIFKHKEKWVLKISYWFLMSTKKSQNLAPQLEEGITEVCFKNRSDSMECLSNTYGNIKILLQAVL